MVPPPQFTPAPRVVVSARLRPELADALNDLIRELQAEGWQIQKHHVLEYLLQGLESPEGRARIRAGLERG